MDSFEKEILEKLQNGEELSSAELSALVDEYAYDNIYGQKYRWTQDVKTYIKLGEKFYEIEWQCGLSEMQKSIYSNQPVEVFRHEQLVVEKQSVYLKSQNVEPKRFVMHTDLIDKFYKGHESVFKVLDESESKISILLPSK